jgi:hypothetical protein
MVHLRQQCPAIIAEALDEPHLPQRMTAIEGVRHHAPDELLEPESVLGR